MLEGDFAPNFPLKHQQKEWGVEGCDRGGSLKNKGVLEVNIRKMPIFHILLSVITF